MQQLTKDQMKWHRQQLKKARRAGLSDLENAHQIVVEIESLGKALHGSSNANLGKVECCLIALGVGLTLIHYAARLQGNATTLSMTLTS